MGTDAAGDIEMAHANQGMGGSSASAAHSAKAQENTKSGGKGVSKKKRPG